MVSKFLQEPLPVMLIRGFKGDQGGEAPPSAVRCTAVESNFCSLLSGIMLSGGAGGMKDAGRLTDDAMDPSSTASWFSFNSFCSF